MEEYFNWEALLEKYYNEAKILKEIIKLFIDDLNKKLEELNDCKEIEKIRFIVHQIKGSSYNITANKLGDISKEIQELCDQKKPLEIILEKLENFKYISEKTIEVMKMYLKD